MAPTRPPHIQPKRAKALIIDGIELSLKQCEKCGNEFYGSKTDSECEDCRSKKKSWQRSFD
jgi:predicted Zn-ribbon and HTH transcriptional regulator